MQFYIPENQEEVTRVDTPSSPPPSHIDMLHHQQLGQIAIEQLYENTGIFAKPERFQLIIRAYSRDVNQPLEICMPEWHILFTRFRNSNIQGMFGDLPSHCCCSQDIEKLYFVQNSVTGNILLVGSECIKKFGSEALKQERTVIGKFYRKCLNCAKSTFFTDIVGGHCSNCDDSAPNDKKCCRACLKLAKIKENNWRCKACIKKQRPYIQIFRYQKTCRRCQKTFYTDADFKDQCIDCYQQRSTQKVFLNVPYAEKENARGFGAKWDPSAKKWWVPGDANFQAMPRNWLLRQ